MTRASPTARTPWRGGRPTQTEIYVLYCEAPDAPVAGDADAFEFRERYSSSDTRTLFIHDSTGLQEH